jgi:host factor-I protein
MMAGKNMQDYFLNQIRKEKMDVTIYLISGVQVRGKVKSFDSFTVVVESGNRQNLIYKHAISTIVPSKPIKLALDEAQNEKE